MYRSQSYFAPCYFRGAPISPVTPTLTLRQAIRAGLRADPGVQAIVGENVWALKIPQGKGKVPAIVYQLPASDRNRTMDGPTGTVIGEFRFAGVALDPSVAEEATIAVRLLFDRPAAQTPYTLLGGVVIEEVISGPEQDAYDPPDDGGDVGRYWTVLNYTFRARERVRPATP